MRYTVDASVLVKLVVEEEYSSHAVNLISDPKAILHAPSIIYHEVGSVLYMMVRKHIVGKEYTMKAYENLIRIPIEVLSDDRSVLPNILDMSLKLGLHFSDCLYIHTAKKTNSLLVSSDRKLLTGAGKECNSIDLRTI
ncbi:MAG: type II toxin-antitoxin system VapC family toxin [Candidatus Nitrosotenuis sp.]